MALPSVVTTQDPRAVQHYVETVFGLLDWASSRPLITRLFADVTRLFRGDFPGYRACDMRYHDFAHTLQATVCIIDLLRGRDAAGTPPRLGQRDAELLLVATLLHDSGFIKTVDDTTGTGAKYTMVHERRSCQFAQAHLPDRGFGAEEIADICAAIGCTGPRNRISAQTFRRPEARTLACLLVTADYLAQMSAPDYADKLDFLFDEFREAFAHEGIPPERQPYRSAEQLKRGTAAFWQKLVLPMLDTEADAVHRFLANTGQPNPYLQAVDANLAEIQRRLPRGMVSV